MKPTVAVVGANGFIGSRVVEMLHLEGDALVRPVVRRASALASSARFALDGRVADAGDAAAMQRALAGADVVVHCVAGDPATIERAAARVYQAADAAGCRRLIYLSTASVHGQSPAPGTDERSPLSDRQPLAYNNAKVRAERRLLELRRTGRLELVVLRPAIVFGPRSSWIAGLAADVEHGRAHFVGDSGGICNTVYVDNLVHAIRLALATPRADGQAYLLGDDEAPTWREFYRPVVEALGRRLEDLPILSYAPPVGVAARIEQVRSSRPVQATLLRLPLRLRLGLTAFYAAVARPDPEEEGLAATLEMALLHGCRHRLPWEKARAELGYAPPVALAEAFRRTIGWLAFAGYPVREGKAG